MNIQFEYLRFIKNYSTFRFKKRRKISFNFPPFDAHSQAYPCIDQETDIRTCVRKYMAAFPCFLSSFLSSVQSLCNSVIDYPRLALESRISRNPPRHRDRRSRLILLLEFFARIQQLMNRFFKFLECSNFPGRKDITFFVFKNRQPFSQV